MRLSRAPGVVHFDTAHGHVGLEGLYIARTDRGVKVAARAAELELDLVEHLFSAFGGLGIYEGVAIRAFGPELPLLDGGAQSFASALKALGVSPRAPRLHVARPARLALGDSVYDFAPSRSRHLTVHVEFAGRGEESASWDGTVAQFLKNIAPARTFGFRSEHRLLSSQGRAAHVDPHSVLILEEDGSVLPPAVPPSADELARHKLLDLVGDLYFFGGPPVGSLNASRPGHTATHAVVRQALDDGILERVGHS